MYTYDDISAAFRSLAAAEAACDAAREAAGDESVTGAFADAATRELGRAELHLAARDVEESRTAANNALNLVVSATQAAETPEARKAVAAAWRAVLHARKYTTRLAASA